MLKASTTKHFFSYIILFLFIYLHLSHSACHLHTFPASLSSIILISLILFHSSSIFLLLCLISYFYLQSHILLIFLPSSSLFLFSQPFSCSLFLIFFVSFNFSSIINCFCKFNIISSCCYSNDFFTSSSTSLIYSSIFILSSISVTMIFNNL